MATANNALRVTELDFNSIRENLKEYLRSQSEFNDYDFDGSGMSVLLDILAYNTHYMAYYINVVSNEMFLDSAQLRKSVLSHAKAIGYVPHSKSMSKVYVDVVATPSIVEDNTATQATINKYTRFLGADIDGINYQFVALNSNTVSKSAGSFTFNDILLGQGEIVTNQYLVNNTTNPKRRYKIPTANVDTSTIVVAVQQSASNTDVQFYIPATDITELNSNSTVFFVEEDEKLEYTFYFGDGIIGKKPSDGNIVICTYLATEGGMANNISEFTLVEPIGGEYSDNVTVTAANSSFGGTEKETIEEARFRAPYYYTTQNRAVTTQDYETLILKDYPNIQSVSVWGGEDNDPIVYGKVFISLKTKQNVALTNQDKEDIKNELIRARNVVAVTPEIVDPDYAYLIINTTVSYNPSQTVLTSNQLEAYVRAAITDYSNDNLTSFDSTFRTSKLQNYIENAEKSITGSDISIFVQKRLIVDVTGSNRIYTLNYNMPLEKGTVGNRIYSYPELIVNDNSGVARNVLFEEILDSKSGINSITVTNTGRGYSSSPTVTITGDGTGATASAVVEDGKITQIRVSNKGSDYTRAVVSITDTNGTGASATALLENDYGTLRTYYYNTAGDKILVNNQAGDINFATGTITLSAFRTAGPIDNDFYDSDVVTFFAPIKEDVIRPLRNRIITIDEGDAKSIVINMTAES